MKSPLTAQVPEQLRLSIAPTVFPERDNALQFIKYMGSKREILDFVVRGINGALEGEAGCTVFDLFAGSASVGYALSSRHRVISNDIQYYSYALSRALLSTSAAVPDSLAVWDLLEPEINKNRTALLAMVGKYADTESRLISSKKIDRSFIRDYGTFMNEYPHAGELNHSATYNGLSKIYSGLLEQRRKNCCSFPYALTTLYFANAYFGITQAVEIDSIRYAIDEVLGEDSGARWVALACLMHAASYCTPGPGHFAQFRGLNSVPVCEDILRYRNRSPKEYFLNKWTDFKTRFRIPQFENNVCAHLDYRKALNTYVRESDLVYADPPYSFVHYSRFYHALETLMKYDYPKSEFYGRYRADRHQSPFCIRSKVKKAFQDIIKPDWQH